MTEKEFFDHLKRIGPEFERLMNRTLPIRIGARAKSLFQENFRKGGFQDGGLHAWQKTRRQLLGNGADSRRGPLLSSRKVLYNSIGYTPGRGSVTIFSNIVYAGIHNEGGTVTTHPKVSPKMRRFAWAMYYKSGGGRKKQGGDSREAEMWKGLALTKKTALTVRASIPRRQFMGESRDLTQSARTIIETEVMKVLDLK